MKKKERDLEEKRSVLNCTSDFFGIPHLSSSERVMTNGWTIRFYMLWLEAALNVMGTSVCFTRGVVLLECAL